MVVSLDMNEANIEKIYPNFIKNRFDLLNSQKYELLCYRDKKENITIMVEYLDYIANLGLFLVPISKKALKQIVKFVFKNHKEVQYIKFKYGHQQLGDEVLTKNNFRIHLPETTELLYERLSKKGKYNITREKKILEQDFGMWSVHEHAAASAEAEQAWEKYFEYKAITHGDRWKNYDKEVYRKASGVSTVYALALGEDKRIAAVILSCEECPVVFLENLTYDSSLAKYSLGKILYDEYLKALIAKKKRELFLLGGNYDYKRRYGSVEETLYDCTITKNARLIKIKIWIQS